MGLGQMGEEDWLGIWNALFTLLAQLRGHQVPWDKRQVR